MKQINMRAHYSLNVIPLTVVLAVFCAFTCYARKNQVNDSNDKSITRGISEVSNRLFYLNIPSRGAMRSPDSLASNRLSDAEKASADAALIKIPQSYLTNLHWDLLLDSVGKNGSTISWKSSNPQVVSDRGRLLKRSPRGGAKIKLTMTATIRSGKSKQVKTFPVSVAYEELNFQNYLFVYFEGSGPVEKQEQIRFGLSADAVNWYALNQNQPILSSAEISQTGGVRDPHILRAEDEKTFYMVATDMQATKNGWNSNPGMIMLRSNDLISWTHSVLDFAKLYPTKFSNVKFVWAPQTIYDPEAEKYLVYFTISFHGDKHLDFYSAYANKDFTAFENEPELMFRAKYGAIDGDIIYKEGLYHYFFKGNTKNESGKEVKRGIQQATSKLLRGPWKEDFRYLDAYVDNPPVEGSSVFKLNNSDEYILMYDVFRSHRYEFQRSTDLFNFTTKPESFNKNFNPRHGSVIGITKDEARRLQAKWSGVPE